MRKQIGVELSETFWGELEGESVETPDRKVPSDDEVKQSVAEYLFGYFCRHLVSLAFRYVELDEKGNPKGQERFIGYSGFIMSISETWFLVTAGHVLKEELNASPQSRKRFPLPWMGILECRIGLVLR